VTVTVRTWPVMVSRDVTGVGVHVEDVDEVVEDRRVVVVEAVLDEDVEVVASRVDVVLKAEEVTVACQIYSQNTAQKEAKDQQAI